MLSQMSPTDQGRLVGAMGAVASLLGATAAARTVLRTHRPGDMGWVVQAHGELYWQEF